MMALRPSDPDDAPPGSSEPVGTFTISESSATALLSFMPDDKVSNNDLEDVVDAVDSIFTEEYYHWCNKTTSILRKVRLIVYDGRGPELWDKVMAVVASWAKIVVDQLVIYGRDEKKRVEFLGKVGQHLVNWKARADCLQMHLTFLNGVVADPAEEDRVDRRTRQVISDFVQQELAKAINQQPSLSSSIEDAITAIYEESFFGTGNRGLIAINNFAEDVKRQNTVTSRPNRADSAFPERVILSVDSVVIRTATTLGQKFLGFDMPAIAARFAELSESDQSLNQADKLLSLWSMSLAAWARKTSAINGCLSEIDLSTYWYSSIIEPLMPQTSALLFIDCLDSYRTGSSLSDREGLANFRRAMECLVSLAPENLRTRVSRVLPGSIADQFIKDFKGLLTANLKENGVSSFNDAIRLVLHVNRYIKQFYGIRDYQDHLLVAVFDTFGDEIAEAIPPYLIDRLSAAGSQPENTDPDDFIVLQKIINIVANMQARSVIAKVEDAVKRLLQVVFLPKTAGSSSNMWDQKDFIAGLRRISDAHLWWTTLVRAADMRNRADPAIHLLHRAAWDTNDDEAIGEIVPSFAPYARNPKSFNGWPVKDFTVKWHNGWSIATVRVGWHIFTCSAIQLALIEALAKATEPLPLAELLAAVPVDADIAQVALGDILELGNGLVVWHSESAKLLALNSNSPGDFSSVYRVRLKPLEPELTPDMWRKPPAKRAPPP